MYLDTGRLFADTPIVEGVAPADCDLLRITCEGFRLYGQIYLPDGSYGGERPCVCLFHGFPGSTVNDDLAQALRRMGCVVLRLFQRGAWGSEGFYSFTNNVRDALSIFKWATEEGARQYPIDTRRIFLAGHSVGGQTALNASRRLPEAAGTILMAPMDMGRLFGRGEEKRLLSLLSCGEGILKEQFAGSFLENLRLHWKDLYFPHAAEELRERSLLLIGAKRDSVAPPDEMLLPLWDELCKFPTGRSRVLMTLDAGHSFCSSRIALAHAVGEWIANVCCAVSSAE